ncbi:MAG: GMC family oxidoreductase [Hyphomicrobiaceae bacterium]
MAGVRDLGTFDYVIVGAGSAGCVLANRLSEDRRYSVALVEAGGQDKNPWIHVPAGYYRTMLDPSVTWQFGSGPEPHLNGRIINWPRGRVVGGTSAINGLLYVRGQARDFDTWRQLGNRGWGYDDVLPYFKRAECQERGEDDFHGADGPLGVSDVRMHSRLCDAYISASVAAGISHTTDFNGANQEGAGYYQLTTRNGRRCSTAVAYLKPIIDRPNLTVITDANVERIELEGKTARALSVRTKAGAARVTAGREVILSAGAIGSPQLLQVSGIGPGQVLKSAGVDVQHELAGVGRNLQDHLQVRFVYEVNLPESLNMVWHSRTRQVMAGLDYMLARQGILAIGAGVAGVFARSHQDLEAPDMQIHFMPLSSVGPGQGLHDFAGVTASVCQLRPDSRGVLEIATGDATDNPKIVCNYLSLDEDRRILLAGLHLLRKIARQKQFSKFIVKEVFPGAEVRDEEQLMAYAREVATTIFHPCGTCKMGSDVMAVVDDRLRVHGIAGLRIADASIMPTLTSGNTNAPTIMIGEKASDMVLEDANARSAA